MSSLYLIFERFQPKIDKDMLFYLHLETVDDLFFGKLIDKYVKRSYDDKSYINVYEVVQDDSPFLDKVAFIKVGELFSL